MCSKRIRAGNAAHFSSHPEKEEDADAGEPDGRVPGPDRLDVLEDADPRVDETPTRNLQAKEERCYDFTV